MKISGFTMGRNVSKLYYPWKQAIESILPIVDEFVVALGHSDPDDTSRAEIESIDSDKIKIVDTVWDLKKYSRGTENAHQTDIAKQHCTGDWLFYLQADEVVHEKYLPVIEKRCRELLDDKEIEGLLFAYKHFWGDYWHYHDSHCWYKNEIRIIRNHPDIHSWKSAQSFRRIPAFDGKDYRQTEDTYKLKVARVDAEIFHYGWVRPPQLMRDKAKALDTIHKGHEKVEELAKAGQYDFDYGPLGQLKKYTEGHPAVMKEWIENFDWQEELNYSTKRHNNKKPHKHEKPKYRLLSKIERFLYKNNHIGKGKNYILLNR